MFELTWQDERAWRQAGGDAAIPPSPDDRPVRRAATLLWQEHCAECSIPYCYSSCQLFSPRRDRKCARFAYGIFPNRNVKGLLEYGADIHFRRWAKLEAVWPSIPDLKPVDFLRQKQSRLSTAQRAFGRAIPLVMPTFPRRKMSGMFKLASEKYVDRLSKPDATEQTSPDAFYLKCYSPSDQPFSLQLELIRDQPVFRKSIDIQPGWNEHVIPFSELTIPAGGERRLIRLLVDGDEEVRLIFTWLDLVQFAEAPTNGAAHPSDKIKCVAWDLDNTLWEGVIGDLGAENVKPNEKMVEKIRLLDERGIIQTIASKNNYDIAWPKIEQLGLEDYFLYPAIHWGPKSESLRNIAKELNINIDTFALIDDSPFERGEITSLLPQVRTYDPAESDDLLDGPEFQVPVTAESKTRRQKYQAESKRKQIVASWSGDYDDFLQSCQMEIKINHPQQEQKQRCLELIQRSNQFHLSTHRYTEAEFDALLSNPSMQCFAFDVSDQFGSYGIVGFAAFECADKPGTEQTCAQTYTLTEFVLSCRVAQKKVDETFLLWYAEQIQRQGASGLQARLKPTDRNQPLQDVLSGLGFQQVDGQNNTRILELTFDPPVEVPSIIQIHDLRTD